MTRERTPRFSYFLMAKGVYKGTMKWNIGGKRDLVRKVWIWGMWSVRGNTQSEVGYSRAPPCDVAHVAAAYKSGTESVI